MSYPEGKISEISDSGIYVHLREYGHEPVKEEEKKRFTYAKCKNCSNIFAVDKVDLSLWICTDWTHDNWDELEWEDGNCKDLMIKDIIT